MSIGALVGGTIASGLIGAYGAGKAADITAGASDRATAEGARQYDLTRADYAPFLEAGTTAVGELGGYGTSRVLEGDYIPASQVPTFDPNIDVTQDPGYLFRQQEQERMLKRQYGGMGQLLSGNRLEGIMQRSGDLASQEYGFPKGS